MFWLRLIQTYLCHEWNIFWGVVDERWQRFATKHMYTDLVIHWLFPQIPILPPQKAKQVPMIVTYKNLEKHIYVCYKCNPFLSKSDQGTNSLISEIRTLLIDLPTYPVLQSKTTWILLGLAGWYTPCWGKYHTFSPVGLSLEISAYHAQEFLP